MTPVEEEGEEGEEGGEGEEGEEGGEGGEGEETTRMNINFIKIVLAITRPDKRR